MLAFYIGVTVAFPLVMYEWSFCWIFIDRVAAATPSPSTPFALGVNQELASAFDDLVYTCVPCFGLAFVFYIIARVKPWSSRSADGAVVATRTMV